MVHDKHVAGFGLSEHANKHSRLISFTAEEQSASQYGFCFTVRRQKEKKIRYWWWQLHVTLPAGNYFTEFRPARSCSSDVATVNADLSWLLGSKANGHCIRAGVCSCDMQCEDYGKPINSCPAGSAFGRVETCGSLSTCPSNRLMGLGRHNIHAQTHGPLSIFFPLFTFTPRITVFQTYLNNHIDET